MSSSKSTATAGHPSKRVVITGMGALSPLGKNVSEMRQSLIQGRSGIRYSKELEELRFSCRVGGFVDGWQDLAASRLSESDRFGMGQSMQLAALAAMEAMDDAKLEITPDDKPAQADFGAVIGTGIGGLDVFSEKVYENVKAGRVKRCGSSVVEQIMGSGVSAKIGGLFGLGNQVSSNSSACNTGSEAIVMAADRIRHGLAKRMLAGGAEAAHPMIWSGFEAMRVIARQWNDAPEKASRPMSADSGGFVPSSGAGILVLESLESALARGAPIHGEILSGHVCSGGMRGGGSMTAPAAEGVRRCIREALLKAHVESRNIDYINGHLTSTFADPLEIENWRAALELPASEFPLINSTKSLMGHALGASGAVESIATLIQMQDGFVHASLNSETLHESIKPVKKSVAQELRKPEKGSLEIAAKASFGFGDVNSCIIFKKWS